MAFRYLKRPVDVIITDGQFKGNRGWNLGAFRFRGNFLIVVRIEHRIEDGMVIPLHGFRRGHEFRRDEFAQLDKHGNIARRELKGR